MIALVGKVDSFNNWHLLFASYEKQEFQQKVADVFHRIYKSEQDYWHAMNADTTKEAIHDEIAKIAINKLNELKENAPLDVLK